jgi:selenocysteine lyase/cysteine desulfurase
LLSFPGRDCQDAYRFLADRGVNAPAGTFYALEASRRFGFGDGGALRVGLAPYTDDGDVDRLLAGLAAFVDVRSAA